MSAVIVPFPSKPRQLSERRRVAKQSVDERANATNASADARLAAVAAAFSSLDRGDSLGWAIQCGLAKLPSVRLAPVYGQPTFPGDAA